MDGTRRGVRRTGNPDEAWWPFSVPGQVGRFIWVGTQVVIPPLTLATFGCGLAAILLTKAAYRLHHTNIQLFVSLNQCNDSFVITWPQTPALNVSVNKNFSRKTFHEEYKKVAWHFFMRRHFEFEISRKFRFKKKCKWATIMSRK